MTCPTCNHPRSRVIETRNPDATTTTTRTLTPGTIYRRRQCKCGTTWETLEITQRTIYTKHTTNMQQTHQKRV